MSEILKEKLSLRHGQTVSLTSARETSLLQHNRFSTAAGPSPAGEALRPRSPGRYSGAARCREQVSDGRRLCFLALCHCDTTT